MNKSQYREYLKGEHWKNVKKSFYKVNARKCVECSSTVNLNLHHLTYDRLGKERLSDLVCLCEDCHHKLHENLKTQKKSPKKKKRKANKVSCTKCKFFAFGYYCNKKDKSAPYGYPTYCKYYRRKK